MYDTIIIGAGISGLYMAYRLSEKNSNILLIDKNNYVGGRILTIYDTYNKQKIQYEAGAGRIANVHVNFIKLLEELQLQEQLLEISNERIPVVRGLTYKTRKRLQQEYNTKQKLDIAYLIKKILRNSKKFTDIQLRNMSMFNLAQHVLKYPASDFLLDAFGYESELLHLNAYDGVRMFQKSFNFNNKYFILKSGLSKVCDILYEILVSRGVTIQLGKNFNNFSYIKSKDIFEIITQDAFTKNTYTSKKLVLAIPKKALMQLENLKSIGKKLNSVIGHDLHRIYAIYPKNKDGNFWFYDLPKITTDNPLQFIIPYNKSSGLIMISYSDDYFANYWKQSMMNNTLHSDLHKYLKLLFPNRSIPTPTYLKSYFWKDGAHFYRPGYNSEKMYESITQPFSDKQLYIIGECYSLHQAWIEGAITSANKALQKINKYINQKVNKNKNSKKQKKNKVTPEILNNLPRYTLQEVSKHNTVKDAWIIIDDFVLDVTKWLPEHPGGSSIMKGLGKDATKMWYQVPYHNTDIALRYFPKFLIGYYDRNP